MRFPTAALPALLACLPALAQATLPPPGAPPGPEAVRKAMGLPSTMDVRGQQDTVGFASRADQMARVWELSAAPPAPERLGPRPAPGLAGAICPHDDYLYAGRVYREVLPLVTARTVILVGVFHKARRYGVRDVLVLDPYRAWRAPDGEIPVSPLRQDLKAGLAPADALTDAGMHDGEHSIEALAYWLRHARPDLEILPVLVPIAGLPRLRELAARAGDVLGAALKARGWTLGRDVAVVVSSDGVHYGQDFKYVPHGASGLEAYARACEVERGLLRGPLAGPLTPAKVATFFETCVDPQNPEAYRLTWCGRFSVPFGLMLLERMAGALGQGTPVGHPVAFDTSVGAATLPLAQVGLGATAPANLHHFVGYPGVAYTLVR